MIQAVVFFPLIGALIAGLLGRFIGARTAEYVSTGLLLAAALCAWSIFLPKGFGGGAAEARGPAPPMKVEVLRWVEPGRLGLNWALRVDTLTAVMLVVVTTV